MAPRRQDLAQTRRASSMLVVLCAACTSKSPRAEQASTSQQPEPTEVVRDGAASELDPVPPAPQAQAVPEDVVIPIKATFPAAWNKPPATGWWRASVPCPEGAELRTRALRLSSGARRMLSAWCDKGDAEAPMRQGPVTDWYADGTLRQRGYYDEGALVGAWETFWPTGQLWYRVSYEENQALEGGQFFDASGAALANIPALTLTNLRRCDDQLRDSPAAVAAQLSADFLKVMGSFHQGAGRLERGSCAFDRLDKKLVAENAASNRNARSSGCDPNFGDLIWGDDGICDKWRYSDGELEEYGLAGQLYDSLASGCPDNHEPSDVGNPSRRVYVQGQKVYSYYCQAALSEALPDEVEAVIPVSKKSLSAAVKVVGRKLAKDFELGRPTKSSNARIFWEDEARGLSVEVSTTTDVGGLYPRLPSKLFSKVGLKGYVRIEITEFGDIEDEEPTPLPLPP